MMKKHQLPVRLAIRREGEWVKAYVALQSTMDDALLLGTIDHRIANNYPDIYAKWKAVMVEIGTSTG